MYGRWEVTSNRIDGKTMYRACRKIDRDAVDHSGNREYRGEYCEDYGAVAALVDLLNEQEAGA